MIKVKIEGMQALQAHLAGMQKQVRYAASRALNEVAKKVVERESQELSRLFDRPTPRTLRAVKVFSGATRDRLEVVIGIDDGVGRKEFLQKGKKGTVTPSQYLLAQVVGGSRAPKRFEKALQVIGAMPDGMRAVFAKRSGALDNYGNISGAKLNQIITWFRQYKVDGYGGVMSKATKSKMMKGQRKGMKWGVVYFRGGKEAGLPDGIWERHYPNGTAAKSFIRPILIYVHATTYRPVFQFKGIAEQVVDAEWKKQWDIAISNALRTAK